MNTLGIRGKVLLVFTSVTLAGGLALLLTAGWQLQNATLEFYQHDIQTAALSLANGMVEPLEESEGGQSRILQTLLERNPGHPEMTFTVTDSNRRVLASTEEPRVALGAQLPVTPEIADALNGSLSHTVRTDDSGSKRAYVAVPILYENRVIGLLRASAPMATATHNAREKWYQLIAVALPILLLTVAASLWFGRTLIRPIKQLHTSALHIADGAFEERVTIHSRDEIGQLGDAFNFMAGRISTLMAAQRSFVSNAAHELRAPLMSLKLRSEALQDPTLSADQRAAYLTELTQKINHMSTLITQLLILARLDEGRHQADHPPDDIVAWLHDIARTWRIRVAAAGLRFEAAIPATLPDSAMAASDLQIVLDNLIENAVKYTPPGGRIRLDVSAGDSTLRLRVSDTGEGFDPEARDTLFERFARLSRVREREIPGTGLGLAIVKALLERYGGTVSATSDGPGQGATFEVVFPLVLA